MFYLTDFKDWCDLLWIQDKEADMANFLKSQIFTARHACEKGTQICTHDKTVHKEWGIKTKPCMCNNSPCCLPFLVCCTGDVRAASHTPWPPFLEILKCLSSSSNKAATSKELSLFFFFCNLWYNWPQFNNWNHNLIYQSHHLMNKNVTEKRVCEHFSAYVHDLKESLPRTVCF